LKTAYEASFFGVKENVPDFSPEAHQQTSPQKASHATVSKLIESLIAVEKNCLQLTLLSGALQRLGTKRHRQVLPK